MVYTNMIENHTHKIFVIIHNTSSFNEPTKLFNLYECTNKLQIKFSRNLFSIIKEMLLEFQRIIMDLYKLNDKFLNVVYTDKEFDKENVEWKIDYCRYNNYKNIIKDIKLMGETEMENSLNLLYKNIKEGINVLGKPTSEQIKFVELFYKTNNNLTSNKNSVKWWDDIDTTTILNDINDENFLFFNNMGTLIIIVNNFNDEECNNLYETIKNNMLEHKINIHGINKLKSLRLIMININNEQTTLFKKYCTFDSRSNICFDRYDMCFDENTKESISILIREIFHLNSLTLTNIEMKDDFNPKIFLDVEMFYPNTFVPFENVKQFEKSRETIFSTKMEYENINLLTNVKSVKKLLTHISVWSLAQKTVPLLVQSLPYTLVDFSSRQGRCANNYILNEKYILPELIIKNKIFEKNKLAFCLSNNIDESNGQISVIDGEYYKSRRLKKSYERNLSNENIMNRMLDLINTCISTIEKTNIPGLTIDNDLRKAYIISPENKFPFSMNSKGCFRNNIDKIYPYLKTMIETRNMSKEEMKCILDVISNFRKASKNHEELYTDFCNFYFKDIITSNKSKTLKLLKSKIKVTNKNMIGKFVKSYEDEKPEFSGWINNNNRNNRNVVFLYQNLNNINEKQLFKSKYVVLDSNELLIKKYAEYIQPLSDEYLRMAPLPLFGTSLSNIEYENQMIEYRKSVNSITSGLITTEKILEMEKEYERLRFAYSRILLPSESKNTINLDNRRRKHINRKEKYICKMPKIIDVPPVCLTRSELDFIEKMKDNYRKSIKGKIISVEKFNETIKTLKIEIKKK
ncbi:Hypothetical protein SRAE_1000338500 [Strongyloides ratti]|uniref:Protein asunder n=1 Tax=Strongyloides ratti TaxID=34506 RepID=A0A090L5Y8_STRRB|nr:Hypothetical protein SRAE_1000338500 [Strongyloides ratti]CEF65132.1 Hypothetical protein SRAE_1000338500 [Strongyloides ratti]